MKTSPKIEPVQNTRAVSDFDKIIAERIRLARLAKGLSQERLGEALGVTFQQVQKYEKGVNRVSAGRLHQIAAVLDCDISYFFGDPQGSTESPSLSPGELQLLMRMRSLQPDVRKALHRLLDQMVSNDRVAPAPSTETDPNA